MYRENLESGLYVIMRGRAHKLGAKPITTVSSSPKVVSSIRDSYVRTLRTIAILLIPPYAIFIKNKRQCAWRGDRLLSREKGTVIIFSPNTNRLRIYTDPKDITNRLQAASSLQPFMPILSLNIVEQGIIEQSIFPGIPLNTAQSTIQRRVFKNLVTSVNHADLANQFVRCETEVSKITERIKNIRILLREQPIRKLMDLYSEEIALILRDSTYGPSHGDLHLENILLHEERVGVIDLEHYSDCRPIWYDWLFLAFRSATYNNQPEIMTALNNGDFDDALLPFFPVVAHAFIRDKKLPVWLCFLIVFLESHPNRLEKSSEFDIGKIALGEATSLMDLLNTTILNI